MEETFSKKDLARLIKPLIVEQFLAVTVGMADVVMVARVGEAAVSGVSLVDTLSTLIIQIMAALATGGAVVTSHYVGQKKREKACETADQLVLVMMTLAIGLMVIALVFNKQLLTHIFNTDDSEIMSNAVVYFYLSAISYPFLGFYNACAALCRAMGNSKISMKASYRMNFVNVFLNAVLLYGFKMDAAGVGLATLIARITAAVFMYREIRNQDNIVHISRRFKIIFKGAMIKEILRIGVPTGFENSIFQLGKLLVSSLISSFGKPSIAANAAANTITSFAVIPAAAIGLAMVTVVGQTAGAGKYDEATKYIKKLMKYAYISLAALNVVVFIFIKPIISVYGLSDAANEILYKILVYHAFACVLVWPMSFTLPNALRAAGDVKYTMIVSIASMWIWRIAFSYYLGSVQGLLAFGVWISMSIDWLCRGTCFLIRLKSKKWQRYT